MDQWMPCFVLEWLRSGWRRLISRGLRGLFQQSHAERDALPAGLDSAGHGLAAARDELEQPDGEASAAETLTQQSSAHMRTLPTMHLSPVQEDQQGLSGDEAPEPHSEPGANAEHRCIAEVGDSIQYFSTTHGSWLPAWVQRVDEDGQMMINIKPNRWISRSEQALNIRLPQDAPRLHILPRQDAQGPAESRTHVPPNARAMTMDISQSLGRAALRTLTNVPLLNRSIVEPVATQVFATEEEENMRKLYLEMITGSPDAILAELALPLKQELEQSEIADGEISNISVSVDEKVVSVEKEAFCIGRLDFCDVQIPERHSDVSRIQCWIFNLPGAMMVVDGWSLAGTFLVDRESSGGDFPASRPHARRVFLVPHGEAVMLRLGRSCSVTLNPKLCIVCCERPRSVRLTCGHQAFCGRCMSIQERSGGLAECPLCRAPLWRSAEVAHNAACLATMHAPVPVAGGVVHEYL
eukprot:TRINITY_DN89091_c0_g1_i1.p1 TRINITY_DN89091_c0_g1~~TRINITY_DN89091_c0_g1_i1.p1  ORF type:complete len:474 (-),score=79.33 TRINITY_DN89091_c0_g1_i1:38-1438(-)